METQNGLSECPVEYLSGAVGIRIGTVSHTYMEETTLENGGQIHRNCQNPKELSKSIIGTVKTQMIGAVSHTKQVGNLAKNCWESNDRNYKSRR